MNWRLPSERAKLTTDLISTLHSVRSLVSLNNKREEELILANAAVVVVVASCQLNHVTLRERTMVEVNQHFQSKNAHPGGSLSLHD